MILPESTPNFNDRGGRFMLTTLLHNPAFYCERWYPWIRQALTVVLIVIVYVILKLVAALLLPAI